MSATPSTGPPVEDVIAGPSWLPASAELDYNRPILRDHEPSLVTSLTPDHASVWLLIGTQRLASARLTR